MYSSLPDAPQPVGDLIGLSFRLIRRNLRLVFATLIFPTVLISLGGLALQWAFTYGFADAVESASKMKAETIFGLAGVGFVALGIYFFGWWLLALRMLALVRYVLGFAPDIKEAKAYMSRRKFATVGVYSIGWLLFMFALGLSVAFLGMGSFASAFISMPMLRTVLISGTVALGGAAVILSIVFYVLAAHLSFCLLACEDESGVMSVIGRSCELVGKYLWRSIAFGVLFMITFIVINAPLSLPMGVLAGIDYVQHGIASKEGISAAYKPPIYLMVITQAWESAVGIVVRPLVLFAFGLFYYDLRMRSEGLDIKRKLADLDAKMLGAG